METIAIIGFSFSGTVFFLNLVKQNLPKNLKIIIFEKEDINQSNITLGPAFSPFCDDYILNVTASNMSAYSNFPDDFINFLIKNHPTIYSKISKDNYHSFAPRKIYGQYLAKIKKQALDIAKSKSVNYQIIYQEVKSIQNHNNQLTITTNSNEFKADKIILATGLKQANLPFSLINKNFIKNLWSNQYFNFHNQPLPPTLKIKNSVITLIGTGLSAVDVIIGLINKNFTGKIIVLSRRGNFPNRHLGQANRLNNPPIEVEDAKKGILYINLKIRKFLKQNPDLDLRNVVAAIRPITSKLWHSFDLKNKKRFIKLLPYWNIFRHLAPISSINAIDQLINNGQLEIKKGSISKISNSSNKIIIHHKNKKFETDYLVNCLGFETNAAKYPLFSSMIKNNLLKKDLIMATSNHPNIFLLAGLNIAADFEITSVPDIRVQVESLVKKLQNKFSL